MTVIAIIVLFLVFKAIRERRPLKIILTPEEAHSVSVRWWSCAKKELVTWAVIAGLAVVLLGQNLESGHWKTMTYVVITWGSLLLFSRIAIWLTLAIAILSYLLYAMGIHLWPAAAPFSMATACVAAIIARAILFLLSACCPYRPVSQPQPQQRRPVYDLEDRNP